MEIIGEKAHRMLAYVEAVRRQGYALGTAEFIAYAEQWDQKVTIAGVDGELMQAMAQMKSATAAFLGTGRRQVEPMIDYLLRVRWISETDAKIGITPLGKAVLREANAPLPGSDTASTLEVIIDPSSPFAYAQLMAKISGLAECLIIDPYLDEQQLLTLAGFPNVTRILTGDKYLTSKAPLFSLALQAAPHLEVRTVQQGDLHDRFAIPAEGSAYMLGSSLGSIAKRFGVATTLEESSSRLISANYESIWKRGKSIPKHEPKERSAAKQPVPAK